MHKHLITLSISIVTLVSYNSTSHSGCIFEPTITWSYPAEGDVDVPIDSRFWFTGSGVVSVSLDGTIINEQNQDGHTTGILMPSLEPSQTYNLTLTFTQSDGAQPPHTISFTTSDQTTPTPPPSEPIIESVVYAHYSEHPDDNVLFRHACLDGGESEYRIFVQKRGDAFAWTIEEPYRWESIWPQSLGDLLQFRSEQYNDYERKTTCYNLVAINKAGIRSKSQTVCPWKDILLIDEGQNDPPMEQTDVEPINSTSPIDSEDTGCSTLLNGRSNLPFKPLIFLMVGLLLALKRAKSD